MEYVALIAIAFASVQLVVSFINLIFNQRLQNKISAAYLVSVLIPARDEEDNIVNILSDLQRQDYQNLEILVFDDQSTDKTAERVLQIAEIDNRVQLLTSGGLPEGWLGKNHACHSLALQARGEYFLFLDADVRIKNGLLNGAVAMADNSKTGLVSIFPRQQMSTLGELLTVPLMKYILLSLLPLVLVRKSHFASLSAANGQFMLFNSEIYRKLLPHMKMKDRKAEDIEIARYLKKNNVSVACIGSDYNISCRMYHSFSEAVDGFAKNVKMFFGNSYILSVLFWLITSFGFIPVFFYCGFTRLIIYLTAIIFTRVAVSIAGNEPVLINVLITPFQQLSLGLIIARSFYLKMKKEYLWKGRKLA
jgi:glycosyltransferase involved in cell wall biosynthesis